MFLNEWSGVEGVQPFSRCGVGLGALSDPPRSGDSAARSAVRWRPAAVDRVDRAVHVMGRTVARSARRFGQAVQRRRLRRARQHALHQRAQQAVRGVGGDGRISGLAGRAATRGRHIGLGVVGCGAAAGRGSGARDAGADHRFAARNPVSANGHRHRDAEGCCPRWAAPWAWPCSASIWRAMRPAAWWPHWRRLHRGGAGRPAGLCRRLGAAGPAGADRPGAARDRLSGVPLGRPHRPLPEASRRPVARGCRAKEPPTTVPSSKAFRRRAHSATRKAPRSDP